jgi:hypothetical protein
MGLFFSFPAICPIYPESDDDEDATYKYISSPIVSAAIHDDNVAFDDDVSPMQQCVNEGKSKKHANTRKDAS